MAFGLLVQEGRLAVSGQWPPAGRGAGPSGALARDKKVEASARVSALHPEERLILRWLVSGWGVRQICRELGIDASTCDLKRDQIFRKIAARSTADAVRTAIYAGLDR